MNSQRDQNPLSGAASLSRAIFGGLFILLLLANSVLVAADPPPKVDSSTLQRKVMCGYQGWFRCEGDGTQDGWLHWSRDSRRLRPETPAIEMWPDLSEFTAAEKFPAPGFRYPNDKPAELFSSAHPLTVERHFRWMQAHGIDGVFVQRFLVELGRPSFDLVLENVRKSAEKTGRTYAIGYDLSGMPAERIVERLARDWQRLVEKDKITADDRYLKHRGKPVVFVWGFFPDRFSPAIAHRILDLFQGEGSAGATLIGGCPWYWRKERDPEWQKAFRRFDVISPWNVGNYHVVDGKRQANTTPWREDLAAAQSAGREFLPVIYPGFGWTNLKGKEAAKQTLPRLGGEFYWRQFVAAAALEIQMAYVAMFDEVDEGTAIFKVTNTPPTQAPFDTYEGLPSDWYLRLTGEGTRVIRREKKGEIKLPIQP